MTSTILGKAASFGCTKSRQKFKATGLSPDYRDVIQGPQALAQPKGIGFSSASVVIGMLIGDETPRWSGLDLKADGTIAVEQEGTR